MIVIVAEETITVVFLLSSGYFAYLLISWFAPYRRKLREFEANIYSILLSTVIWLANHLTALAVMR